MCVNCGIISDLFNATKQNPIIGSKRVYQLLLEMYSRGRLLAYSTTDCSFENVIEFLKTSQESQCQFFFECPKCPSYFYFQLDKNGKSSYDRVKEIPNQLK